MALNQVGVSHILKHVLEYSGRYTTAEQGGEKANVPEKKPKIKWPKANDTATYKQFEEEVSKLVRRCKGSTEEKLPWRFGESVEARKEQE